MPGVRHPAYSPFRDTGRTAIPHAVMEMPCSRHQGCSRGTWRRYRGKAGGHVVARAAGPVLPCTVTEKETAPEHHCSGAIHMVRLAGIEPTTPWFVAKYSIQLSYSR